MRYVQRGFTLVELMVALVIGTIIILGAGQLFLTTFQTFQNVDKISRKQENLVFIAQRVTREIRQNGPGRFTLECELEQVQEKDQCTCTVADTNEGNQPLISFRKDLASENLSDCLVEERKLGEPVSDSDALYRVVLPIENNGESIVFHVAHRAAVLGTEQSRDENDENDEDARQPDPNNPGYYMNGDQMYNDRCYVPGNGNLNTNRNGCDAP
ncbi:Type IV pilin N-term methylation site GFxxxE [Vreelandella subterranea]|uniref:Type IV pilin N-term methylation site GFxxxE n=1 Tax=Vreelandella subterranea TaxID=416874 RepID=A0A1H9P0F8_9GAMM|nr:prepilin-type N-terminal cleavage/methylation domain-containing protein [Halomonas subterranea]SER41405.1 Type IV pilin N-term methylation site GFxxxE [Halomonas subterranea]